MFRREFMSFLGSIPFLRSFSFKKDSVIQIPEDQRYFVRYALDNGFRITYFLNGGICREDGPAIVQVKENYVRWIWINKHGFQKSIEYNNNSQEFIVKISSCEEASKSLYFNVHSQKLLVNVNLDENAWGKSITFNLKNNSATTYEINENGYYESPFKSLSNVDYKWFESQIGVTFEQLRNYQDEGK